MSNFWFSQTLKSADGPLPFDRTLFKNDRFYVISPDNTVMANFSRGDIGHSVILDGNNAEQVISYSNSDRAVTLAGSIGGTWNNAIEETEEKIPANQD